MKTEYMYITSNIYTFCNKNELLVTTTPSLFNFLIKRLFLDRPPSSCSNDREVEETLTKRGRRRKRWKRRSVSSRKTNNSRISSVSRASSKTKSYASSRHSSLSARYVTSFACLTIIFVIQ